jgi:hypothetical protein
VSARKAMRPHLAHRDGYVVASTGVVISATRDGETFGGGMADLGRPRVIEFTLIEPDGAEHARKGWAWAPLEHRRKGARTWRGFWVRDTRDQQWYAVLQPAARTQVGRVRGTRYRPGHGRVVEAGEYFSERHPDSPSGALTQAARTRISLPTVIRVDPLPPHVMGALSGGRPEPSVTLSNQSSD